MFIDKSDGTIYLPTGVVIRPTLTKNSFLHSSIGSIAGDVSMDPKNSLLVFAGRVEDKIIGCELGFIGEALASVGVKFDEPGEVSEKWNEETQMRIKAYHDEYLLKELGSPPYIYDWGIVWSSYNARDVDSTIGIKYADVTDPFTYEKLRELLNKQYGPPKV